MKCCNEFDQVVNVFVKDGIYRLVEDPETNPPYGCLIWVENNKPIKSLNKISCES